MGPVKWLHRKNREKGRGADERMGWARALRGREPAVKPSPGGAGGGGGAGPGVLCPVNLRAFVLLLPAGPSSQRQVQNGPSPDEMDIQRR